MILNSNPSGGMLPRRLPSMAFTLTLLFATIAPLFADSAYLTTNSFDTISLLPPPPAPGSAEETADLASTRTVFNGRTDAEKTRAMKDSGLSFSLFQPAIGPTFNLQNLPKTKALLEKVKKDIGQVIDAPKNHYK